MWHTGSELVAFSPDGKFLASASEPLSGASGVLGRDESLSETLAYEIKLWQMTQP
ncbi:MAG: hypothetical protein ACFB4I_06090 [Cyanophyceae cyanobacterium]